MLQRLHQVLFRSQLPSPTIKLSGEQLPVETGREPPLASMPSSVKIDREEVVIDLPEQLNRQMTEHRVRK